MKKYEITDPDGRTAIISAPDSIPSEEVMSFAQESWESWRDGGTYEMVSDDEPVVTAPMSPRAIEMAAGGDTAKSAMVSAKNESADKRAAELQTKLEQLHAQRRALDPEDVGGSENLWAQISEVQGELDRYRVGSTGETVGGIGGGIAGAVTGAGLGAMTGPFAPIGIPVGAALGGIAGAAGGAALGTHLYDIPVAREARDITDEEAVALIKGRAIESVIFDGAFMLILGPGGKVVGKMARGSRLGPAIKGVAREALDWTKTADKARIAKIADERAALDPTLASDVSKAVGVTKPADEARAATAETIRSMSARTEKGQIPTAGEMTGETARSERMARKFHPEVFEKNDRELAAAASDIRDEAMEMLNRQGAAGNIELGDRILAVQKAADARLKAATRPAFQNAVNAKTGDPLGISMIDLKDQIAKVLDADAKSAGKNLSAAERAELTRTHGMLDADRLMSPEAVLNFISGSKRQMRGIEAGVQPTPYFKKVLVELVDTADQEFVNEVKRGGDAKVVKNLLAARKLYSETMGDLYSDTMATAALLNSEDVGKRFTSGGSVTEIRELRNALARAEANASGRVKAAGGKAAMAAERRSIDAGLVKGFLEKNTANLSQLDAKLQNPDFRATLNELLLGKGAADPVFNRKLLAELDKVAAAIKLADPLHAAGPGRFGLPGQGSAVAGVAHETGAGPFGLLAGLAAIMTGRSALNKLVAKAMTSHSTGTVNKVARAIALSKPAQKSVAAAEMLRTLLEEINAEIGPLQDEPMEDAYPQLQMEN